MYDVYEMHVMNYLLVYIIHSGARATWRTEKKSFSGGSFNSHASTMVSFKGGHATMAAGSSDSSSSSTNKASSSSTMVTSSSGFFAASSSDDNSSSSSSVFRSFSTSTDGIAQISSAVGAMDIADVAAESKLASSHDEEGSSQLRFELSDDGGLNFSTS